MLARFLSAKDGHSDRGSSVLVVPTQSTDHRLCKLGIADPRVLGPRRSVARALEIRPGHQLFRRLSASHAHSEHLRRRGASSSARRTCRLLTVRVRPALQNSSHAARHERGCQRREEPRGSVRLREVDSAGRAQPLRFVRQSADHGDPPRAAVAVAFPRRWPGFSSTQRRALPRIDLTLAARPRYASRLRTRSFRPGLRAVLLPISGVAFSRSDGRNHHCLADARVLGRAQGPGWSGGCMDRGGGGHQGDTSRGARILRCPTALDGAGRSASGGSGRDICDRGDRRSLRPHRLCQSRLTGGQQGIGAVHERESAGVHVPLRHATQRRDLAGSGGGRSSGVAGALGVFGAAVAFSERGHRAIGPARHTLAHGGCAWRIRGRRNPCRSDFVEPLLGLDGAADHRARR
jgi:hypothetical protein